MVSMICGKCTSVSTIVDKKNLKSSFYDMLLHEKTCNGDYESEGEQEGK